MPTEQSSGSGSCWLGALCVFLFWNYPGCFFGVRPAHGATSLSLSFVSSLGASLFPYTQNMKHLTAPQGSSLEILLNINAFRSSLPCSRSWGSKWMCSTWHLSQLQEWWGGLPLLKKARGNTPVHHSWERIQQTEQLPCALQICQRSSADKLQPHFFRTSQIHRV